MNRLEVVAVLIGLSSLIGCQAPAAAPAAPATTAAPATSAAASAAPTTAAAPAAQPATTSAAPAAAAQAPQTLKIGNIASLTGPVAPTGIVGANVHQMVAEEVNAKGGLKVGDKTYRIEVVRIDDKFSAEGGREAADRLLFAEKVKIIVGPASGSQCAGAQPVVEQANALMVSSACTPPENLGPKHPTTLSAGVPHGIARIGAISNWVAKAYPQLKRVGILPFNDATGNAEVAVFKAAIPAAGLELVATEPFPPDTKEFGPIVTRLLAQKPDIVMLGAAPSVSPVPSLGIAKALAEQNFKGPFLGAFASGDFVKAGAAAEGFVGPVPMEVNATVIPAPARDFYNRYVQKYGEASADIGNVVYISLNGQVLYQAIAKAGTVDDVAKIAEVMRSNQWDTTVGKLGFGGVKTFGGPAYLEAPVYLSNVQGGKFVTFEVQPGTVP